MCTCVKRTQIQIDNWLRLTSKSWTEEAAYNKELVNVEAVILTKTNAILKIFPVSHFLLRASIPHQNLSGYPWMRKNV